MFEVAAIILAAGRSTRMGCNKMLAEINGKPLVRHVVEMALASKARPVYVVTGHEQDALVAALQGLDICFVHNADYAAGMSTSLRCGVADLPDRVAGVVVLLGDMPLVPVQSVNSLIEAFRANSEKLAIVPVISGERGNPVLLARAMYANIAKLTGDCGARKLLDAASNGVFELAINEPYLLLDVDTPVALSKIC